MRGVENEPVSLEEAIQGGNRLIGLVARQGKRPVAVQQRGVANHLLVDRVGAKPPAGAGQAFACAAQRSDRRLGAEPPLTEQPGVTRAGLPLDIGTRQPLLRGGKPVLTPTGRFGR